VKVSSRSYPRYERDGSSWLKFEVKIHTKYNSLGSLHKTEEYKVGIPLDSKIHTRQS